MRPRICWRSRRYEPSRLFLSRTMNSMSGMWPSSFASTRPMIQVKRVSGQARCKVRTTGSTWQVSPMADRRSMQTLAGGVSKRLDMNGSGAARNCC